jgi:peptidoglycan/xylan/chitin deacetylase (PgdA/CDA1 family)
VSAAQRLKRAVKRGFASPLGWRLGGPLLRKPGVIVLTYHRILGADRSLVGIPVENFAAEMRWVRDNCDPIRPEAIVERARQPRGARPAVLVTFDDGYRDYHDLAYPVLKALRIPAVVFLATSFMDAGGMLWTDEVQLAAQGTTKDRATLPWGDGGGATVELPDAAARAALGERARAHLKKLPNEARRAALDALLAELGRPPARDRQMLSWDEVRAASELTIWGGHTHNHPILSRLPADQAEGEIRTCRDRIAAETGKTPTTFAYPNGQPADYTEETKAILRSNGFSLAFSTSRGIAGPDSDWMAIKRLPGEANNVEDFVWMAAGLARE